jgi:hypothetical protein
MNDLNKITEDLSENLPTKEDEQRAVQYIRYRLIPFFVDNVYNKLFKFYPKAHIDDFPRIGYQTFRNNLKKYSVRENLIIYHCDITKRLYVTFYISKQEDKGLVVSYHHQLPITDQKQNKFIKVQADPPTELKENKENKEIGEEDISKIEEQQALQFIRNVLINEISKEYGLDANIIRKTLKKIKYDIHSNWTDIRYRANTGRLHSDIDFSIYKNDKENLCVGVDHSEWEDALHTSYCVPDYISKNLVKENTIPQELAKYSISKMEEDQAVDFIKKRLIPKIVEYINDTSKHYTGHRQITSLEVNRTVKKIGQYKQHTYGYIRELVYQALFLGEPFEFDIFKNTGGKLVVLQKSDGTTHLVK